MLFIDKIALTQRHAPGVSVPDTAGIRVLSYRNPGDIQRDGSVLDGDVPEVVRDRALSAWIQGSHETRLQLMGESEDRFVGIMGNVGRFEREDNIFNLDLPSTVARSNQILSDRGFPPFSPGESYAPNQHLDGSSNLTDIELSNTKWTGARVWEIHITQNYSTGSMSNARIFHDWLIQQSQTRVKKQVFGSSTVCFGGIRYAQTEYYLKADELLQHQKPDQRAEYKKSKIYQWASDLGIVRAEVKLMKSYLNQNGLSFLGAWDMGTVHRIFNERTEIIQRAQCSAPEFDSSELSSKLRAAYLLWIKGEDLSTLFPERTLRRHRNALIPYGFDISERRNIEQFPIRVRTIDLQPLAVPDWYSLIAA